MLTSGFTEIRLWSDNIYLQTETTDDVWRHQANSLIEHKVTIP
jgi:hypothetical protein